MTKIEWTDRTLNPIRARNRETGKVGWWCVHASEGCRNCYAERMNVWRGNGVPFKAQYRDKIELFLDKNTLVQPLRWRKPSKIFICDMTDLFGDFVPDEWIDQVFAMMALARHHTFQVLTKRPARMLAYLNAPERRDRIENLAFDWAEILYGREAAEEWNRVESPWPLPNVWLGTSVEDVRQANERIPLLLETPAAVRFLSCEPLLGPVDLECIWMRMSSGGESLTNVLRRHPIIREAWPAIDWVIVGGESGPNARPLWTPNVRSIVRQCKKAGVAVFVKQLGANVRDRNDAGFEGCGPTEWPDIDPARLEHNPNGYLEEYQGAPVRIRLKDRKGGDPAEWPEDLRVREFPA